MRIIQLVESLDVGGLERMALDLSRAEKGHGHEVTVFCLFGAGAMGREAEDAGIAVETFGKGNGFQPGLIFRLAARMRARRAEVVHTHNLGAHVYGAPAAFLARVPAVVSTRHGFINSTGQPYQENKFRFFLPVTDAVVAVSEHTEKYLAGPGGVPRKKLRTIHNGIREDSFVAHPARPGAEAPRVRFGTVGRMVPVKGHAILLDAFAEVAKEYPHADLRIVGGGPLEEALKAQVRRLGLEDRVRLEGVRTDIASVLSELDCFVFSSLNEGLPMAILEAMASGLPIVSTRVGGVPEVAAEGLVAWYAEPGNTADLARAMKAALTGDLARRGAEARRLVLERYTLAVMASRYEALYRECAGPGSLA